MYHYLLEIGALTWLEGRVYETVGARRARGALQVRDNMLQSGGALPRSRGTFMNRWGAIFSKRDDIRYLPARGAPVWLEGRVYETVGACRARGALQVRDSMLTGRRGAATGSLGRLYESVGALPGEGHRYKQKR